MVGEFLRSVDSEEIKPAVLIILGKALPESDKGSMDVGYRTIIKAASSGQQRLFSEGMVSIGEVYSIFKEIADAKGPGSRKTKENLLGGLLSRLDESEKEYLVRSLFGEMRVGVSEGVMLDAIAYASGARMESVRNAFMLSGDVGEVATTAIAKGKEQLDGVAIKLFTPIRPMLAEMSSGVEEVIRTLGEAAFEFKLDGARIQIHSDGRRVKIFSRRLTEVTESLPEIVSIVRSQIDAEQFIMEGEAVAFKDRPLPFQEVMRRFTRVHDVVDSSRAIPLKLYLFDVLWLEDRALIDLPYTTRWDELQKVAPPELIVPRLVTGDVGAAEEFYKKALAEGHEGLVAKGLDSPYAVGKRGKRWLKIKKSESLDLVIVAADWGYGRRIGWLSDYYLAAVSGDGYEVIGKTFKGFTDVEFEMITKRLLALKVSETRHTVQVRPEIVVQVVFDEVQKSPKYAAGLALRLARIQSIRDDKRPKDADTIETVRRVYERQFDTKDRLDRPEDVRSDNDYIAGSL